MKTITIGVCFIVWCIFTLLLACSLVGIIVLVREDHNIRSFQGEIGEAIWFRIGKRLINKLCDDGL
jgi:hypothetical protein